MIKKPNINARKALDQMKLEIAREISVDPATPGKIGSSMTRRQVQEKQGQFPEYEIPDSFNPS